MLLLRRLLFAALLTGLMMGCQRKTTPEGAALTPDEIRAKKIKKVQEPPEGPPAPPLRK